MITIGSSFNGVREWYTETFNWRESEYAKLTGLQAGFSMEMFRKRLGDPIFRTIVPESKRRLTQSTFAGRGYWAHIISDETDVVLAYSVTSCARDFQPTFTTKTSPPSTITLNKTPFPAIQVNAEATTESFIAGATANSYVYQFLYQGNPSGYKTYGWGLNDACPWHPAKGERDLLNDWTNWRISPEGEEFEQKEQKKDPGPKMRELLAASTVNTYMETSPYAGGNDQAIKELYPAQLGVDRVTVRTYPLPDAGD
ncbi:ETEC_3214 domain-containing protein [Spongiactinospora sp. 9N601]|uniref:ETEC_3214 domain-containing protein n=1 Tax=Spongiactinospora sp. 9N601 TaxID=3375149 RepID=UPI0037A668EF